MEHFFSGKWIRRILFAGILVQVLFLAVSFPHAPFNVNEAWLGEQSYREAHDGVVHQQLLAGVVGNGERTVVRHKLFIFAGDMAVRAFGFHLGVLRAISLVAWMVLVVLVWFSLYRRERMEGVGPLAVFILLCCPLFLKYAQVFRPEMLLTLFGFVSFLLVFRASEQEDAYSSSALAGLAAGLAVLTHLNGVIFVVAGFGTFLLARKGREAALFLVVSLALASVYFYDVIGNYHLFTAQLFNDLTVEDGDYRGNAVFLKLFHEHERYFRTPEIIGISALFVVSLAGSFRKKRETCGALYPYTLLLVVSLALVAKGITTKYAIPVFPFFALGIANSVSMMARGEVWVWRPVAVFFLVLGIGYAGYGMYSGGNAAFSRHRDIVAENALIASSMTPGTKVLAAGRFIYNEIGRFEIRDLYAARYVITHEKRRKFNLSSLCEYAVAENFDYIVLDAEYRQEGKIDPRRILPRVWGYEALKGYTDGTVLLRRTGRTIR